MFSVKICGVTRREDAVVVAEAGADAIGLNFYPPSPRCVSLDQAAEIASAVCGGPLLVGVFVNATAEEIERACGQANLGAIQLHGDEPPEAVLTLPAGLPVIRAARIGEQGVAPAAAYAEACRDLGRPLSALLLDATAPRRPGEAEAYGGTGHRLDWDLVAAERLLVGETRLILAGGLRAENVGEAITKTGADGVDTASGVESAPGVKEHELVRRFVANARAALGL